MHHTAWPVWTQKPAAKPQQFNLFNPDSIRPSSLVSWAKSVQQLGEKQLTTLRMTVLSARTPAKSALKDPNFSSRKRKVHFSDFVVEKQSNDIYLTRMNLEEEEDPEWKSKLIVDKQILDKLTVQVHTLIEKLRSVPADISTTAESVYGLQAGLDAMPPKKLPDVKSSTKIKRNSIKKIFEDRILELAEPEEGFYSGVCLSDWNKYLPGLLCFLNIKRELLSQILRESEEGNSYIVSLYNHELVLESYETNDVFEEHGGTLSRCSGPFVLKNGKMEFWNCILDKFLRQYTGRSVFKTKDFLQAFLGAPIKQQNTIEIKMLSQFLKFHTQNYYVLSQLKNGCCFVEGLKIWQIDGEEYQLVVVATFQHENIRCSLKYSPLYEKCSYLQKVHLANLEDCHRMLVLKEDFRVNFPKILVGCKFGQDLTTTQIMIGSSRVAFIESEYSQNIVLKLTSQESREIVVAMAELYMNESDVHFKKKVKGQEIIYHRIESGYYEIQTSAMCKLEIFSHSDLRILEQTVPQSRQ